MTWTMTDSGSEGHEQMNDSVCVCGVNKIMVYLPTHEERKKKRKLCIYMPMGGNVLR